MGDVRAAIVIPSDLAMPHKIVGDNYTVERSVRGVWTFAVHLPDGWVMGSGFDSCASALIAAAAVHAKRIGGAA